MTNPSWDPFFMASKEAGRCPRSWSNGLGKEPAVYSEVNAGNETAGPFTREEDRGAGQFRRDPEACYRRMAQNYLTARRGGCRLLQEQTTGFPSPEQPRPS